MKVNLFKNFDGLSNKVKKRLGRGNGSGHGKTSGRGTKGQNARANKRVISGWGNPLQLSAPAIGRARKNKVLSDSVFISLPLRLFLDVIGQCADNICNRESMVKAKIISINCKKRIKIIGNTANIDNIKCKIDGTFFVFSENSKKFLQSKGAFIV